ncbi:MAG: acyl-CoA dehydrogenase C-terminal domain-containing protein [Pseudomonadota bacterium]
MPSYTPPLKEMLFLLRDVLKIEQYSDIPSLKEATDDLITPILTEAGKLSSELLHPLNAIGDEKGCVLKDKKVITPEGFKEAYKEFIQGGWTSLTCDPEYDGQGLPVVLGGMVSEMLSSANMSFAMYPGLTHGAYSALYAYGSEVQKKTYLPKLVSGEWTGTMNLTEPHCGTDLGLLTTKAEVEADGSYKITGQKIFISAGDHDLAENIIHLVLARISGAPEGVKGISLFVVPKYEVNDDGSLGAANRLECAKLEEKMGIHGNATCVMNFDGAKGWLVGPEHAGLKAMFIMMNEARIGVGLQGLSQSEIAYQNALEYAKDRVQGRALSGAKYPEAKADPIIVHPDIRRNLMHLKVFNEAARAFIADISLKFDLSHHHPDEKVKEKMDDYVSLMTPVVKGYLTDKAFDLTVMAQQVYGGHGYIKEWGMDQFVRDSRIAMIYEGANGIQGLDLVGRKLGKNGGRAVMSYIQELDTFIKHHKDITDMETYVFGLSECKEELQKACMWLMQNAMKDPEQAGATSTYVMHMFGITALAYEWNKMAKAALNGIDGDDKSFCQTKLKSATYFMAHYVPEIAMLARRIASGKAAIMALNEDEF